VSYIRLSRFYLSVALSSMILVACGEETVTKESTPKANIETTSESQTTISPEQNDSSSIQSSQENAAVEEQKELTKNQDPFNWNHVSGWHTQGIISKSSPIQINFNRHVIEKALVGSDASKVMFITPEIEGKPVFNTQSSIMWQPEEPLEHGTEYKVTIKPLNLKDVPQDAPPLQFAFNVIPLEYQIKTLGLSSVSKKPDEMLLKGEMLVSDSISDEDAQSILSAKLQNKPLVVEWLHDNNGKQHNFIIRNIKRDTFETTLQLNWTGKQLNIESEGQKEISIPSTSDFKITNISVIHEKESDPFVEILFSDEIDKTQNLNGLVKLSKNEYNVSVKNNGIYIYPKRNITGDFSVRIFKGIKAKNDLCTFDVCKKTLKDDFEQVVSFNDAKPQVKFVGKGTILPSNSILEIPFDAVGVSAVDVTAFKVHSDNVGQFLQVNGLSGDTEINRVNQINGIVFHSMLQN